MEVLVLTDKPWHDPAALWHTGIKGDHLLLLVGSEKDRVCLSFTLEEAQAMMMQWTALVAKFEGVGHG
jgi:hypothetical protein